MEDEGGRKTPSEDKSNLCPSLFFLPVSFQEFEISAKLSVSTDVRPVMEHGSIPLSSGTSAVTRA